MTSTPRTDLPPTYKLLSGSKDERQHIRRLLNERVQCKWAGKKWSCHFADLSASGAFLESPEIPPLGSPIDLDFSLPFPQRGIRVRFFIRAEVTRTQVEEDHDVLFPQGFSTRFLELTPKEYGCLKAYTNSLMA
jgi:hypothetical protein